MNDVRLEKNLGYLKEVTTTAKAIIEATKEKDINIQEDKRMFSKGTIEKYTQQTKDKENDEEEMEIG
jgi:hypothetical protein